MLDIIKVADEADLIVNGYAFTKCAEGYKVLNLNRPDCAVVLSLEGEVQETKSNVYSFLPETMVVSMVAEDWGPMVIQNDVEEKQHSCRENFFVWVLFF